MTRSDLVNALSARFPSLVAKDAEISVREILAEMAHTLARGDRIEIRFSLNYRPPRLGRNPKTGSKVEVPAKHIPHFKAGKEMREGVDQSVQAQPLKKVA